MRVLQFEKIYKPKTFYMIKQLKPFLFIGISILIAVLACNKNDVNLTPNQTLVSKVILSLKDSVSTQDFSSLDSKKTVVYKLDEEHKVLHISTQDSNRFILVETDNAGIIIKGKILQFTSNANGIKSESSTFNGTINVTTLNGNQIKQSVVVNNYISKQQTNTGITSNFVEEKIKPLDDDPQVDIYELNATVLGIRHLNTGALDFAFNMLLVGGIGNPDEYVPIYPNYGDGSGDILTVNIERPEDKKSVDPKKMIDCFGTISSIGATYSISIQSNLPIANDPFAIINNKLEAGHAFVTLTKTNSNGESITQVMGFYPVNTYFAISLSNVSSMIVNDQGHDYGSSYTISVNENQFQNALNQAIKLSNKDYNLSNFNCTDFALGVFNSGGGNLQVTPFTIPPTFMNPFSVNINSSPTSLYNSIQNLQNQGYNNTNFGKLKASSSHGPC
jgi:hypothetical protein